VEGGREQAGRGRGSVSRAAPQSGSGFACGDAEDAWVGRGCACVDG